MRLEADRMTGLVLDDAGRAARSATSSSKSAGCASTTSPSACCGEQLTAALFLNASYRNPDDRLGIRDPAARHR